jgi:hypothetical protein
MSNERAKLAHDLSQVLEGDLKDAKNNMLTCAGRVQVSLLLEKEVTKVIRQLDADMTSAAPPFKDAQGCNKAKHYLGRALASCMSVSKKSTGERLMAEGMAQAFQRTIVMLKEIQVSDSAEQPSANAVSVQSIAPDETVVNESPSERPVGKRPGMSVAQRRRAEAAAERNHDLHPRS